MVTSTHNCRWYHILAGVLLLVGIFPCLFPRLWSVTFPPTAVADSDSSVLNWKTANAADQVPWESRTRTAETLRDDYKDFLGRDWRASRGFGFTAAFSSLFSLLLIWFSLYAAAVLCLGIMVVFSSLFSLLFICFSLYAAAVLCLGIMVVFQSVTFAVIASDFCDDADCELGNGAGFSLTAVLCSFFSGVVSLLGVHPGEEWPSLSPSHPGDEDAEAAATTGKGSHEEASSLLADTEELTVEDNQPTE
jgi:hypothetical protein